MQRATVLTLLRNEETTLVLGHSESYVDNEDLSSYRSILMPENVLNLNLKLYINQSTAAIRESLRKLANFKFELVEEK